MSVNGITSTSEASYSYQTASRKNSSAESTSSSDSASAINSAGVVYEPSSSSASSASSAAKTKGADPALVAKMKADSDQRTTQLRSIVEQLISKQGSTFATASGDNMWKILAGGDFTVDEATKKQAQADISEDGYYGVKQTSDRIVDFATALAGNDTDKLEDMRQAFIKGYKQATKTWGRELPQISQDTYKAVMEKFDKLEGKTSDSSSDSTSADVTSAQA
jgi:hypothetical protein